MGSDCPWLDVAIAEIGVKETPGKGLAPRIHEYYTAVGRGTNTDDVEAWCSAFANWCMQKCGLQGSGSPAARSWMKWGAKLGTPKRGAVVVFSRPPETWTGHVALISGVRSNGDLIVVGGNQGNKVCLAVYPRQRVLGYRWPTTEQLSLLA